MGPNNTTEIPNPEQLDFMHIKVKVGGGTVSGDLSKDLSIPDDPEELAREIARYPSQYCYWASVSEVAKRELEKLKNRHDMWYSEKYLAAKKEMVGEFGKSYVTDTLIKAKIYEDFKEECEEWLEALSKAEYRKSILGVAANSFKEKGSSMINILSWKKQQLNDSGKM
jgi:hypothetical protein